MREILAGSSSAVMYVRRMQVLTGVRKVKGPSWSQRQAETQPSISQPLEVTSYTDVVTPTVCVCVCVNVQNQQLKAEILIKILIVYILSTVGHIQPWLCAL